ncbi:MAG: diguanylate cyclase [Mesorhizobium sp.]|nr:MAG: diguanylate cyclase [Mesorhizobium sp.]
MSCADRVTISVGVATTVPSETEMPNDFVNAADLALFQAKAEGRNRVVVYRMPAIEKIESIRTSAPVRSADERP